MAQMREAELEQLYARLEKPLYNVVYRWLWDVNQSRDVVQEAFLRCWKKREHIKPDGFKAFVFKTALNLASNESRRKRLWQFVSISPENAGESGHDAEATFLSKPLRSAIDGLPEQLKRVLLLSEIAGMSYREIAVVTGVKEGTVGSRRSRALAMLRARLEIQGVNWDES